MQPSSQSPLLPSNAIHGTDLFLYYSFTFLSAAEFKSQTPILRLKVGPHPPPVQNSLNTAEAVVALVSLMLPGLSQALPFHSSPMS